MDEIPLDRVRRRARRSNGDYTVCSLCTVFERQNERASDESVSWATGRRFAATFCLFSSCYLALSLQLAGNN